jgi:triosephosphate isomerase
MKKFGVFSNLKIFMESRSEIIKYCEEIKENISLIDLDLIEIFIMPDFLSFETMKKLLSPFGIKVGVQDLYWEDGGSFSGEVSPKMLKDLNCDCVYLGHSERRTFFGETDENVNRKVRAAIRNEITPFIFVGETKEEYNLEETTNVLERQLKICLRDLNRDQLQKTILFYEPRWAIGQKESASLEHISRCHEKIRNTVSDLYDQETANDLRILYGGSVNLQNVEEIIRLSQVDGIGVARASLNIPDFFRIIKTVEAESYKKGRSN